MTTPAPPPARVRYCWAARAAENQIYGAMSGVCGNLPNVGNMAVHYAKGRSAGAVRPAVCLEPHPGRSRT